MTLEQDYIDLFTHNRKGHMAKYIYMHRPKVYDEILRQGLYYPFRMESELLNEMSANICKNFINIKQVLEIGPGSKTPILSKTIPFLKALKSKVGSFSYTAIDSTLEYAKQACIHVRQHLNNIETRPIEIDFLDFNAFDQIPYGQHFNGNKLMVAFGQPIFTNNNDGDIEILLNNISHFLNKGDYLLFGIDTNLNEILLQSAYNTRSTHKLLLNSMYHLKAKLNLKDFNPEAFNLTCKWNSEQRKVELGLKATTQQIIKINEKNLVIDKGQEFNIIDSRRPQIETIRSYLTKENLIINDVIFSEIDKSNTFSIIIAQRQ